MAIALVALSACRDLLFTPSGSSSRMPLAVSYQVLPEFARFVSGPDAAFNKADRVRVRVAHPQGVLIDTVVGFTPAPEVRLRFALNVERPIRDAQVLVELRRGNDALFFGTDSVSLVPGEAATSTMASVGLIPRPAAIQVPRTVQMNEIGDTVQLSGAAVFATGDTVPNVPFTWNTLDPELVQVSPSGRVVSKANGTARVIASAAGLTDTSRITIRARTGPGRITFSLTPPSGNADWGRADQLWLHLDRSGTAVLDTVVPLVPGQTEVRVALDVNATRVADSLNVATEVRAGNQPLLRGTVPTTVTAYETTAASVALGSVVPTLARGSDHACGLAADGSAYCWGRNDSGQIGNPETPWIGNTTPVAVSGGLRFQSLTSGYKYNCGLVAGGQAYCWGMNNSGQLGNGRVETTWPFAQTTPAPVSGGVAFAVISGGGDWSGRSAHTCGISLEGDAYCWGSNSSGQLGTGGGSSTVPARVATTLKFKTISSGPAFTCAVTTAGQGYCWGANAAGQLGNGSRTASALPVKVSGDQRYLTIAVGSRHACGIAVTGRAFCWGAGYSPTPARLGGNVVFNTLSLGQDHGCGVAADGTAYCWGGNYLGRLGSGNHDGYNAPNPVTGGLKFTSFATGTVGSCGRTAIGAVYCWGQKGLGQIGEGSIGLSSTPVAVTGGSGLSHVSMGAWHGCGLDSSGAAQCWGANERGQLGRGSAGYASSAGSAGPVSTTLRFRSVSSGGRHTCALTQGGEAYCWGSNQFGQLGNASTAAGQTTPVAVSGGLLFAEISAGWAHTCGITTAGASYCWGDNAQGQLGDGSVTGANAPVQVAGGVELASIRSGAHHTCGVTSSGAAFCWGNNEVGQLGNGTRTSSRIPVRVVGDILFRSVDPGGVDFSPSSGYTCGLATDGAAYCWGPEEGCKLGNSSCNPGTVFPYPVAVFGGLHFNTLSAGAFTVCGVATDGITHCWGSNFTGTLGVGFRGERIGSTNTDPGSGRPVPVAGLVPSTSVTATNDTVCGTSTAGATSCWGNAAWGAMGNGLFDFVLTPHQVSGGFAFR